jgi:hypothetical protein
MTQGKSKTAAALPMTTTLGKGQAALAPDKAAAAAAVGNCYSDGTSEAVAPVAASDSNTLVTANPLGSTRRYPFDPLVSCVFTFPEHLHWFLLCEARQIPVRPLLKNRQRAVLGRLARRNGASKWRQTLHTCGGELEEHAQIF